MAQSKIGKHACYAIAVTASDATGEEPVGVPKDADIDLIQTRTLDDWYRQFGGVIGHICPPGSDAVIEVDFSSLANADPITTMVTVVVMRGAGDEEAYGSLFEHPRFASPSLRRERERLIALRSIGEEARASDDDARAKSAEEETREIIEKVVGWDPIRDAQLRGIAADEINPAFYLVDATSPQGQVPGSSG